MKGHAFFEEEIIRKWHKYINEIKNLERHWVIFNYNLGTKTPLAKGIQFC